MNQRAQILANIASAIDAIEAEMRRIGYWHPHPPDLLARADAGEIQHYLDAPTFELWLQCIFLARARQAVCDDALPAHSDVGTMALRQYDYHSTIPEAHGLMRLLSEFDELVNAAAVAR